MTQGVRIVLLGRQGAGKGTQADRLAVRYDVPHVSTGDMLRAAVKAGTEFGQRAKAVMDSGQLVSDDIMFGIVEERLSEPDAKSGYLLDGFPRNVAQARKLEDITSGDPIDAVIDLDVAEDVVIERITHRRVCVSCGAIYSVEHPPTNPWDCDRCGGQVVQRDDDTEEAVKKRLALYAEETLPLLPFYEERGLLETVDGLGTPDEVSERLAEVVDRRTAQSGS